MSTNLRTTRKVVGSLAIAGTAAAVAGLGTYGTFTSSTTPVSTQITAGSVSINLGQPTGAYSIPATTTGFVPGDSLTRAVTLTNSGSGLASVTLGATATTSNALTTDLTNGLQLSVKSCSVAYTQGGTAAAPTYTCSGTESTLLNGGPVATNAVLPNLKALNPGGVDNLIFTISLPTTADNSFQNLTAALNLTFTGTQRSGGAR